MSDYNFLMETRLSAEQFKVINHLGRLAGEQGLNLYLAGGAVRDLTYGQQVVRDLDFVVEGNPHRILRPLESSRASGSSRASASGTGGPEVRLEYSRFDSRLNAADLRFVGGVRAELAMARQENYARYGQRPEIVPAMIFEDLKRRDFSVNAMAVSLHPNSRGLLLDPTNGAADIERRELRVLHSRSFSEDPSRVYRLLRLGLRLDFKAEERTQTYLAAALERRMGENLDPDQQARELRAILREDHPVRVLKMLTEKGLLAGLDRKLSSTRILYDHFAKVRSAVQNLPGADPFLLYFHCLVEKLSSGHRTRLARQIIGESRTVKLALSLEKEAKKLSRVLGSAKVKLPSQVYALLSQQPRPLVLFLLVNATSSKVLKRVKDYLFKYPQIRARLPHAELQAIGAKPGLAFEKVLEQVFRDQLDGKIKTHQQLTKALYAYSGIKEPPPPKPAKPVKSPKATPGAVPPGKAGKKAAEGLTAPSPRPPGKPAKHGGKPVAAPPPTVQPPSGGKPAAAHPPAVALQKAALVGKKPAAAAKKPAQRPARPARRVKGRKK